MTALTYMGAEIRDWVSQNALGVGGYSGFSYIFLGQVTGQDITILGNVVNTFAHINIFIAFAVGALTLTVKAIEFKDKLKKKKDEANRDS